MCPRGWVGGQAGARQRGLAGGAASAALGATHDTRQWRSGGETWCTGHACCRVRPCPLHALVGCSMARDLRNPPCRLRTRMMMKGRPYSSKASDMLTGQRASLGARGAGCSPLPAWSAAPSRLLASLTGVGWGRAGAGLVLYSDQAVVGRPASPSTHACCDLRPRRGNRKQRFAGTQAGVKDCRPECHKVVFFDRTAGWRLGPQPGGRSGMQEHAPEGRLRRALLQLVYNPTGPFYTGRLSQTNARLCLPTTRSLPCCNQPARPSGTSPAPGRPR